MVFFASRATRTVSLLLAFIAYQPSASAGTKYSVVQSIAAPTNAVQLAYSPAYNRLILKNSSSAVAVIDLATAKSSTHFAITNFTDMSLSPDQRYLFVADYGGENIGYGTPAGQHYVHRLDLKSGTWDIESTYMAGNIQAESGKKVLLKSRDQWVTFYNAKWTGEDAMQQINSGNGSFTGYYPGVYYGDFRYDANTGRLIHGGSGSSSAEIHAFKIVDDEFVAQEQTGIYGSADGYGGTVALATDGSAFYYGQLCVDALDVTHTLRVFPEMIYAATGSVAFGNGNYYHAQKGKLLGSLGFSTTVYGLNPAGDDFWAYDAKKNLLRHFVPK
ncbi:YncE family protein [Hydrocarboniphaga sp.]|uniref:YncE family protein n=1 Tax=Hydrocarboniphaga sp. TaxID=2033016 RepID=UPI003D0DA4E3